MNESCTQARLQIGAEPQASSPELRRHLETCGACRSCQSEMVALDADLRTALLLGPTLPVPKPRPVRPRPMRPAPAARTPRVWAMAASVVLAVLGGLLLWIAHVPAGLARDLGAHVAWESRSWSGSQVVSADSLGSVLKAAHVELVSGQDQVTFAQVCYIHGHWVAHLVVRTTQGPVAVLILPDEPVHATHAFHAAGLTGVLLPAAHGSIAVLTQQDTLNLDLARQLGSDVRGVPAAP
jgi:hypothetical protein